MSLGIAYITAKHAFFAVCDQFVWPKDVSVAHDMDFACDAVRFRFQLHNYAVGFMLDRYAIESMGPHQLAMKLYSLVKDCHHTICTHASHYSTKSQSDFVIPDEMLKQGLAFVKIKNDVEKEKKSIYPGKIFFVDDKEETVIVKGAFNKLLQPGLKEQIQKELLIAFAGLSLDRHKLRMRQFNDGILFPEECEPGEI